VTFTIWDRDKKGKKKDSSSIQPLIRAWDTRECYVEGKVSQDSGGLVQSPKAPLVQRTTGEIRLMVVHFATSKRKTDTSFRSRTIAAEGLNLKQSSILIKTIL
jgi:hypothetical protein